MVYTTAVNTRLPNTALSTKFKAPQWFLMLLSPHSLMKQTSKKCLNSKQFCLVLSPLVEAAFHSVHLCNTIPRTYKWVLPGYLVLGWSVQSLHNWYNWERKHFNLSEWKVKMHSASLLHVESTFLPVLCPRLKICTLDLLGCP